MNANNSDFEVLSRRKPRRKLRREEKWRFGGFYSIVQG